MKNILLKIIALAAIVFNYSNVIGQYPYAIRLDRTKGIPSNGIYNILQDKNGFIWLTTNEGLTKYDGFQYKYFKTKNQSSTSGSNIKEDKYGRIWYQNFDGYIYFVEDNKLKNIKQNPPIGFISYGITDQNLFVVQKAGIDIYDLKSLTHIKTINLQLNIPESSTTLKDDFYLISDHIIYKLDKQLNISSSTYFSDKKLHVKYILPYKNSLFVISKHNEDKKLHFFNNKLDHTKTINIPAPNYIQGADTINGNIWLHSPEGIHIYTENGTRLNNNPLYPELSSSKILKDYQNNYWISSINQGLYIVPELQDKIHSITPSYFTTFLKTKINYLFGSQNGEVIATDHHFQNKQIIHAIPENLQTYYIYKDTLDNNLLFSNNGFTFISEKVAYKKTFNIALKEITRVDDKYYAFAASGFIGLFLNPIANKKQTSTWDSLFLNHRTKDEPQIAIIKSGFRAKSVAYQKAQNRLLFATSTGLISITPNTVEDVKFGDEIFFANKIITTKSSTYILNTRGNIFSLHHKNHLIPINPSSLLPIDGVRMIKNFGELLIVLTKDYIYTIKNNHIKKINIELSNINIHDFWYDDSMLTALTDNGILTLPQNIKREAITPRFVINQFLVNNKKQNWAQTLHLNYEQNNIQIDFSILEFVNHNIPVYYRINKSNWKIINRESRSLQFPMLASGNYTIEFKIKDQISNQKLNFDIQLPFWKKWWFYLLSSISIITILYIYFKYRDNTMRKKVSLLNEKIELEKNLGKSILASIKSQMNPHFFFNALNTIQAYIFTNEKTKASNYLSKFSKLTRTILEMSEKEFVTLQEDLEAIRLYLDLEKMRFSTNFEYNIHIGSSIDLDAIEIPPMLIQPYIENAIKHGLLHQTGDKKLSIDIQQRENNIEIQIDDNGIGRKKSYELNAIKNKNHKSFATDANNKRLEILNKYLNNPIAIQIIDKETNNKSLGTTVILTISQK